MSLPNLSKLNPDQAERLIAMFAAHVGMTVEQLRQLSRSTDPDEKAELDRLFMIFAVDCYLDSRKPLRTWPATVREFSGITSQAELREWRLNRQALLNPRRRG
jgi:hypothetical protein